MNNFNLRQLKLHLFSSKIRHNDPHLLLHNRTYELWEEVWTPMLLKNQVTLKPDLFIRQDLIPAITFGNEVVGLHFYTFFNLLAQYTLKNPYFDGFSTESMNHFYENNMQTIMTMEYLTVNPKWRKSITGISFAEVLIGIATKIIQTYNIDACFGTALSETNVGGMIKLFGGYAKQSGIMRSNFPTHLVIIPQATVTPHSDPKIASLIDRLWDKRIDCTNFLTPKAINALRRAG